MQTYLPKKTELKFKWYIIDAAERVPGKVAVAAARVLAGKHRVDYTPHLDLGDGVIIINAAKIRFSGKKLDGKLYYRHSGYKGNLKTTTAGEMLAKKPTNVLKLAVSGMLPKNKLRAARLLRLKIYTESEHAHAAQSPITLTV